MLDQYVNDWQTDLNLESATRGSGSNKLRTDRTYKTTYQTEPYLTCIILRQHCSANAKVRCRVAPIHLETGRYEHLDIGSRVCFECKSEIVDEKHVFIRCPLYNDLRHDTFKNCQCFQNMSGEEKLIFILNCSQTHLLRTCEKFCFNVLKKQRDSLYK